ncbi:MAG: hypothetical protein JEY99_01015 [Spirochaetales bacterium]|nr:hypothetical protein [Spirochaetales bacterium]
MNNKYMILFAVGNDRPGIVEEVSAFLYDRNANIEDSRMAALGGRFSIMCLFSCSPEELEKINSGLDILDSQGIKTSLHEADDPKNLKSEAFLPLFLEVVSMDHPGIVQKVVGILKKHEVTITTLDTVVKSMPHSGAPLFDLSLKADVPAKAVIGKIKEELNELAFEMNLDLKYTN